MKATKYSQFGRIQQSLVIKVFNKISPPPLLAMADVRPALPRDAGPPPAQGCHLGGHVGGQDGHWEAGKVRTAGGGVGQAGEKLQIEHIVQIIYACVSQNVRQLCDLRRRRDVGQI